MKMKLENLERKNYTIHSITEYPIHTVSRGYDIPAEWEELKPKIFILQEEVSTEAFETIHEFAKKKGAEDVREEVKKLAKDTAYACVDYNRCVIYCAYAFDDPAHVLELRAILGTADWVYNG